jgi:hypothetical protein
LADQADPQVAPQALGESGARVTPEATRAEAHDAVGTEHPAGAVDQDGAAFSTGDASVDSALHRLAELDERRLEEHAAIYDDIHRELRSALDGPPGE